MYRWIGNNLYEGYPHEDGWRGKLAMVRPYGGAWRVIIRGTDTRVPMFIKYETQEEAMEATVGFVKLLGETL